MAAENVRWYVTIDIEVEAPDPLSAAEAAWFELGNLYEDRESDGVTVAVIADGDPPPAVDVLIHATRA